MNNEQRDQKTLDHMSSGGQSNNKSDRLVRYVNLSNVKSIQSGSGLHLQSAFNLAESTASRRQAIQPQNPLRLSIEKKAKKNKEMYLKSKLEARQQLFGIGSIPAAVLAQIGG